MEDLASKYILDSDCQEPNTQVRRLLRENQELIDQLNELKLQVTGSGLSFKFWPDFADFPACKWPWNQAFHSKKTQSFFIPDSSNKPNKLSSSSKQRSIYLNKEEVMADPMVEMYIWDIKDETKKEIAKYKLEMQKLEQDTTQYKANIIRLEGQVARYKESAEYYENSEDELKTARRHLQKENREQKNLLDEYKQQISYLEKRIERIRKYKEDS